MNRWLMGSICLMVAGLSAWLFVSRLIAAGPIVATVSVGMYPTAMAVDPSTGRVLVLNAYDTTVSVLDGATGSPETMTTVGSNGGAHPQRLAIDGRTVHAFVLTDDGRINMLDSRSGRLLRSIPVSGSPQFIVIDAGAARGFEANVDAGTIGIINTRTGSLVRTIAVGSFPGEIAYNSATGYVFVANQGDSTVSMVNASLGRVSRLLRVGDPPDSLAVGAHGRTVLVAGTHGSVTAFDAATGAVRFRVIPFRQSAQAVHVLVAADDPAGFMAIALGNRLLELDPATGQTVHALRLPSSISALAVEPGSGTLLATVRGAVDAAGHFRERGSLVAIGSGARIVAMVGVGIGPSALALDPATDRVFVANTNLNPDGSRANLPPAPGNGLSALTRWLRLRLPGSTPTLSSTSAAGSVTVLRLDRL